MSSNTSDTRTLFVTKLHSSVTASRLRSVFEKYDPIKRTEVIACPLQAYDRGSVEFKHEADAQDALKDIDSKNHIGEWNWYVSDDPRDIDHVEDCYTRSATEEEEEEVVMVENSKPREAVEEEDRSLDSSPAEQLATRSSSDSVATNHTTFPNHVKVGNNYADHIHSAVGKIESVKVPQEFKHLTFGTVRDVIRILVSMAAQNNSQ